MSRHCLDEAFLPAGTAPEWEAIGFRLARRPYVDRRHHATRDGECSPTEHWSIDLTAGLALRWGDREWCTVAQLSDPADPNQAEAEPSESRAPGLPQFIVQCLELGWTLDAEQDGGPVDLGNRWLRDRDGRRVLAIVSSRTLVAPGFVPVEFVPQQPTDDRRERAQIIPHFIPAQPHTHSGRSVQAALFT